MSDAKVIGVGSSTGSSGGSAVTVPPNPETSFTASWVYASPDQNGNPQVLVTVNAIAPSPVGSFVGFGNFLDTPDSAVSGGLVPINVADGSQPADGSIPSNTVFSPVAYGQCMLLPRQSTMTSSYLAPAPKEDQLWRAYGAPFSVGQKPVPVQFGQVGASPSYQFLVTAAGGSQPTLPNTRLGREFAPLVGTPELTTGLTWASNPLYEQVDSGDQEWKAAIDWPWPSTQPDWASMGGVKLVLDDGTEDFPPTNVIGVVNTPVGGQGRGRVRSQVSGYFKGIWQPVRLPSYTYKIWVVSFDTMGNTNTIVAGITPFVSFTIVRQKGVYGVEFTSLAQSDGVNTMIQVSQFSASDGTAMLQCQGFWKNFAPSDPTRDPTFAGAQLVALKTDGNIYIVGGGSIAPISVNVPQPPTAQSWAFYLRSEDVNGKWNSISPTLTFSGGGGSAAVAVATVTAGVITAVTTINAGTGYSTPPTIAVNVGASGGGSGAVITCTVSSGAITGYTISNGGSGYTSTPMSVVAVGGSKKFDISQADQSKWSSQFSWPSNVPTIAALNVNVLTAGTLKIGNSGSGNPIEITVYDHLNAAIGWIGDDTANTGYVGGWFKQLRIGGSSPVNAPFWCDASGSVIMGGTGITGNAFITIENSFGVGVAQMGASIYTITVNTSGTAVTRTAGTSFNTRMVGTVVNINNAGYTVVSYTDSSHITLSSSAGTQTGVKLDFSGGWFQQLGIGGASDNPVFLSDYAGNVSIVGATFDLSIGGITTSIKNIVDGVAGAVGVKVLDNSGGRYSVAVPVGFYAFETTSSVVCSLTNVLDGAGPARAGRCGVFNTDGNTIGLIETFTGGNGCRLYLSTPTNTAILSATGRTLSFNGTQVLTSRQTGWAAPTGTLSRATFDQSTVTLAQLAQRVAALIVDITTHGAIGA